ncbi:MAG: protein kinase [Polyangiales bacterium]
MARNGEILLGTMRTSRVGKYEIIDEIGHGGMATVYRARDTRLDRLVALKVMHPHLQGAKEARVRFAREAVTIARLKHPNILEIYDYSGEDGDTHYIATELLTGPTLKQLCDEHPDMPAEIAACLVILAARALGAAHAEGVIHRDVKPENVMMHENRAVKLTDFGIAQLVDVQGMTITGQVLGSPAHMAPEQIEGKDCDGRSDIFSLGTVLYLLATGELPFQGRNAHQVLKQIVDGQFRDPLRVKAQIGGRLRNVILRCLQVDPAQRYPTARALEDDLMTFVRAAGIDNPSEVISRYLKGTRAFSTAFRARIVEAEMLLGEQAMKAGDLPLAMDAFNRVLSIDEHNERVLKLVNNLGKRQKLRRVGSWIVLAVSLTCVTAVLVHALAGRPEGSGDATAAASQPGVQPPARSDDPQGANGANGAKPSAPVPTQPPTAAADSIPATTPVEAPDTTPRPDPRAGAPKAGNGKPDEPVQPVDATAPRHVVLRPQPANVSISIDRAAPRNFGPSFRDVYLTPGPHSFAFKGAHDCCLDEEVSINIPAGTGSYLVAHKLRFRSAGLYISSNAPADVVIDQALSGRTWSVIQVPQPNDMFAPHVIVVRAPGHHEKTLEVRLQAGQVHQVNVTLQKIAEGSPPGTP